MKDVSIVPSKFVFRTNRRQLASVASLGNGRVLPIKVNANQTLNRKGHDHGYLYFFFLRLQVFSFAMTGPTYVSLIELMIGWVFAPRRTIMGMLRAGGG